MATLNLGRIKPVFRGAYAGGTAYVIDDIVTSGDETFICIQASTGNATSNASYWTKLAAKGTNGTDVGTTITTQGDILYRDGSGLQRLAAGTSGQVLQTGGSGANPSWTSISSDMVKVKDVQHTGSNVTTYDVDGFITSDYDIYEIFIYNYLHANTGSQVQLRVKTAGGVITSGVYDYCVTGYTSAGNALTGASNNQVHIQIGQDASSDTEKVSTYKITLFNPMDTTRWKQMQIQSAYFCNNSSDQRFLNGSAIYKQGTAVTGIQIRGQGTSNIIKHADVVVYGRKS